MPSKPNGTPTSPGETPATVEEKAAATLGTTASRAARSASAAGQRVVATGKQAAEVGGRQLAEGGKRAARLGRKVTLSAANTAARGTKVIKERLSNGDGDVKGQVIVAELPEELKLRYLEALVWLTYQDDRQIDEREVCELQILMTQVACDVESRQVVRDRIAEPTGLDPERIVPRMLELAPDETREAIGYSLLKDAIRLSTATSESGSATAGTGIRRIAGRLEVTQEQLEFIEEACVQDRKILEGEISDGQIVQIAKEMASKAASVGVPIAAVYLSGSVTGLSAAGITSGLATLGLGGVLGLSAMVTGVGTAVVGGVVIYRGARWLMGRKGRIKSVRRELMLQEVLRIHQKAIANLAEDIAYFGDQLVELTRDVVRNQLVIRNLSREMSLLGNALAHLRQKERTLEHALEAEIDQDRTASEEADTTGS